MRWSYEGQALQIRSDGHPEALRSWPICASCWGHEAFVSSSQRRCNALCTEWEQRDVHRDVKVSNMLMDAELNGRRGDFSLARLYEHRKNPQIDKIVNASRCLTSKLSAPERKPRTPMCTTMLLCFWKEARWAQSVFRRAWFCRNGFEDLKLSGEYVVKEMEIVFKLG